ncbi:hypothetical protein Q8A73_014551 [Channa argus]|nr:hypothetical protein Q8A73_014551 [Channa argus]
MFQAAVLSKRKLSTMERLKRALENIISDASRKAGVYTTVILVFTYHIVFDKDFQCRCAGYQFDCWTYMILPVFLIVIFLLWLDNAFQRVWKFTLRKCSCYFFYIILQCFLKALFVGLLWPVSVLIDGDWLICCCDTSSAHQAACTDYGLQSRTIVDVKSKSKIWGLVTLTVIVCLAAIVTSLPLRKRSKQPLVAAEIVLEEGENLGTNRLRQEVKAKLERKIKSYFDNQGENWTQCCFAAEEFIMKDLSVQNSATADNVPESTSPPDAPAHQNEGSKLLDELDASSSAGIPLDTFP